MMFDPQAATKRCEAATPEPWAIGGLNRLFVVAPKRPKHGIITDFGPRAKGHPEREANAEFIVHARSDLPAALEEHSAAIERGVMLWRQFLWLLSAVDRECAAAEQAQAGRAAALEALEEAQGKLNRLREFAETGCADIERGGILAILGESE